MTSRLYYTLALFVFSPIIPWWGLGILAAFGIMRYARYFEAVVFFFIYDLSFGLPGGGFLKSQFSFTIIAVVVVLLAEAYKEHLRLY
jgi:hypothetical protein